MRRQLPRVHCPRGTPATPRRTGTSRVPGSSRDLPSTVAGAYLFLMSGCRSPDRGLRSPPHGSEGLRPELPVSLDRPPNPESPSRPGHRAAIPPRSTRAWGTDGPVRAAGSPPGWDSAARSPTRPSPHCPYRRNRSTYRSHRPPETTSSSSSVRPGKTSSTARARGRQRRKEWGWDSPKEHHSPKRTRNPQANAPFPPHRRHRRPHRPSNRRRTGRPAPRLPTPSCPTLRAEPPGRSNRGFCDEHEGDSGVRQRRRPVRGQLSGTAPFERSVTRPAAASGKTSRWSGRAYPLPRTRS